MATRLRILLAVLCITAAGPTWSQAEDPAPETADVERLVATLQDPQARERLIDDLELLIDASQSADAPAATKVDVMEIARSLLEDIWLAVTSIDPRTLLISGIVSLVIAIAALVIRRLLLSLTRRLYARLAEPEREDEASGGQVDGDARAELPSVISRLVSLIIGVLAVALIAETWGAGLTDLLRTDIGSRIAGALLSIGLILIVTIALWNASEVVVHRLLRLGTSKLDQDRTARRLEALVPLLTSVLHVTISIFSGLLILSELGVNIGPLLAGAGILGLAVGFGAQTLVKDLITGVTILLEDSATVGDVVEVAGHTGAVEALRIRIIQLRDLSGTVHLIPYSEVTTIKNLTKDFAFALFEVGVAYREDTDEVCAALMTVSEDLRADSNLATDILEPGAEDLDRRVCRQRRGHQGAHEDPARQAVDGHARIQSAHEIPLRRTGHRNPVPAHYPVFR